MGDIDPYDYRVENMHGAAVAVCNDMQVSAYDVNADGIVRWRVVAADLVLLRIKLRALDVVP